MYRNKTIAFLGAGSMATSMISGILRNGKISADRIYVTNKGNEQRLEQIKSTYGVKGVSKEQFPYEDIDLFILAMKPKGAAEALSVLKDKLNPEQVVVSVLAGVTTSFMEEHLNKGQQVVRVMPNTSSTVQESATAITPGTNTRRETIQVVKALLECIGKVFIIEEEQMDIFTGIAGSGPAYFYYLMEQMELTGKLNGINEKMVREIVAQTVYGAAKMVMNKGESPTVLRENVTSPNGTTESGLKALKMFNGGEALSQAINHATRRSKELSKELEEVY